MPVSLLFSAAISVGRGGFQSAGSERSHIPENGLGSGPRGPFPPKSSIAIIPEIAQSSLEDFAVQCRILAAIWETVALFGWLATLSFHAVFVRSCFPAPFLSSLFFLPLRRHSRLPRLPCLAVRDCHLFAEFLNRVTNNRWMRRRLFRRRSPDDSCLHGFPHGSPALLPPSLRPYLSPLFC